jgi:hypothetical protein
MSGRDASIGANRWGIAGAMPESCQRVKRVTERERRRNRTRRSAVFSMAQASM